VNKKIVKTFFYIYDLDAIVNECMSD